MRTAEDEETKTDALVLSPLLYFKNPEIGRGAGIGGHGGESVVPLQIAFPDGSIGIGLPVSKVSNGSDQHQREQVPAVVVSGPEFTDQDISERKGIKVAFLVLALVNLIIMSEMFAHAPNVDISNSNPISSPNNIQSVFETVSTTRSSSENTNFALTVLVLLIGCVSIIFDSVVGLSAYALGCLLSMLLGSASIPVYAYSFKYVFDIALLYFALVQRSKLMFTYLPTHIHGQ
jgi:hypothetical protein